jgi:hypothetical protein
MDVLRRNLYIQACVWTLAGLALVVAPRFVLVTVFDQPRHMELAWIRLVGIQAIGLAMLMVIVGHRVEELFWAAWAFAFVTVATAGIAVLNAAFGLTEHEGALLWWLFAAIALVFSLGLLYGIFVASREHPLP